MKYARFAIGKKIKILITNNYANSKWFFSVENNELPGFFARFRERISYFFFFLMCGWLYE